MKFISVIAVVLAAVSSATAVHIRSCNTHYDPATDAEAEALLARRSSRVDTSAPISVPVYFHVVNKGPGVANGNVTTKQIADQLAVLNKDFASTRVSFTLAGRDFTTNPTWFNSVGPNGPENIQMKSKLRKGGKNALNIYTVGFVSGNGVGQTSFTQKIQYVTKDLIGDGVVIRFDTIAGGSLARFNLGRVTTHEVGHWLGLLNTFEGGCSGLGDLVADTPAEAEAALGCPVGRDSCSGGGLDPVTNFMDYTDDACMNHFTPGQAARISAQWALYRA